MEKQDTQTQANPARRTISRLALPVFLIVLTGFTVYNTLAASGAFRGSFPSSMSFSVGAAYSFADSATNVLLPGSYGNITLTVNSAVTKPVTLILSYNTTTPALFGYDQINDPSGNICYAPVNRDLTVTFNGGSVLPINTDLATPANCITSGRGGPGLPTSFTVTVSPGVNVFQAIISASSSASASDFTTLSWFAAQ